MGTSGGINIDFPPIAKDIFTGTVSGINKFGQAMRGELSPQQIQQLAFDTSMNVAGGGIIGSKIIPNAVPSGSLGVFAGKSATNFPAKSFKTVDDVKKLDDAGSLARAKEQGFDVDNPVYHGTNADKLTEFKESTIGSATDQGFFGRGFYFADNAGEAGYYGKNVGKYVVKGNLLDLTNTSGDYTLGGAKQFVNWAEKLDKIDMLDDDTKAGLKGAKKLIKYFDKNVKFTLGQNPDGTTGFFATINDPTRKVDVFEGKKYPSTIDTRVDFRGFFPKTKEEAKKQLFDRFSYEMRTSNYKDIDFFKGWNDDFYFSLSDYIRVGGKGSAELTKQAKKAGFDGIKVGDETVIFDPKNIRSIDAKFDPAKADSPDLLSSVDTQTNRFG